MNKDVMAVISAISQMTPQEQEAVLDYFHNEEIAQNFYIVSDSGDCVPMERCYVFCNVGWTDEDYEEIVASPNPYMEAFRIHEKYNRDEYAP